MNLPNFPYEFYLQFWGQIENENWVERDLGIAEKDFWFPTKAARDSFKKQIIAVAKAHDVLIAFAEYEGYTMRLHTVAHMLLTLPDGRTFPYECDFGYGYPPDSAAYMFEEGNYSCDCNRSSFLADAGYPVEKLGCGDEIKMTELRVTQECIKALPKGHPFLDYQTPEGE